MQIQLSIFLYLYLAFLLLWLTFSIIALYHMFKFGFKNFATHISVILYLVVSAIMLGASFFYIIQVDWTMDLFNVNKSSSIISVWE